MITLTKTFRIENGVAPYTVNVNSVAESTVTFLSSNIVSIELTYELEEQIATTDSVTIFDANQCVSSFPLSITTICED